MISDPNPAAISSFPHGSGAGQDGLRPQHLKNCISITAGDASTSLLTSSTELVNYLANGHLPTDLRPFLYGAQLHGLCKSNGDLRPIAVGCTYRRLVAKVCLRPFIPRLCNLLLPSQVGVGTPWCVKLQSTPPVTSWTNPTMTKFSLNLMLKMPSTAYAETPFFKKLKKTSQKSIPSYGTVILQKHPFFTETSVWIWTLMCNKVTPSAQPSSPLPSMK